MSDKDKVMDKIKKLLALGKSPNEGEATNAMAHAQALLMKHNLSMEEISDEEISDVIEQDVTGERSGIARWEQDLMGSIASSLNCRMIKSKYHVPHKYDPYKYIARQKWRVVGSEADCVVTKYLIEYLKDALHSLTDTHMKGMDLYGNDRKRYRESYMLGACRTVCLKVRDKYKEEMPDSEEMFALVRKKDQAVQDYLDALGCRTMKARRNKVDFGAFGNGLKDGDNIGINQAVRGGDAPQRNLQLN